MMTLEMVMLHQIPDSPNAGKVVRKRAMGIRAPVKMMLEKAGGVVWPVPLNAQAVTDSVTIKICDNAMIFK